MSSLRGQLFLLRGIVAYENTNINHMTGMNVPVIKAMCRFMVATGINVIQV